MHADPDDLGRGESIFNLLTLCLLIRGIYTILVELCVRHHCPQNLSQLDVKKTEYENL